MAKMGEEIKVSVVMPVYNAEKYLEESLGRVVSQTLREIEIICVDDGSTDRSPQIIEEYCASDDRITLIRQKNQYAGVARNHGLKHCRGEYVVFFDADDRFDTEALEKLYRKAKEDDADMCVCDIRKWDSEADKYVLPSNYLRKEFMPEQVPFSVKDIPQYIFNFTTNIPWNKMYRRSYIEKYGLQFEARKSANDVLFVMQALYLAESITIVDERLMDYRYNNSQSLTAKLSDAPLCTYEAFLAAHDALEKRGAFQDERVLQSFANKALNLVVQSVDLQTSEANVRLVFDLLLQEGFHKLGICDREEGYYYSAKVCQAYQTMRTGSLIDTLIVLKSQKNQNLEAHRQRLCAQRQKNAALSEKNAKLRTKIEKQQEKLEEKKQELANIKSQFAFRAVRKLGLVKC